MRENPRAKKLLLIIIAMIIALSLTACEVYYGDGDVKPGATSSPASGTQQPTAQSSASGSAQELNTPQSTPSGGTTASTPPSGTATEPTASGNTELTASSAPSHSAQPPSATTAPSAAAASPSPTTEQPSATQTPTPAPSANSAQPPAATAPNQSGPTFTINKTKYEPGEVIRILVSGVPQSMVNASAFIAIYAASAPHSAYQSYFYVSSGASTETLTAPTEIGSYELRMYKEDENYVAEALLLTVPFTVEAPTASAYTYGNEWLKMTKSSHVTNNGIAVMVTGITAQMEEDICWISIYRKGYKHDEYGEYYYPTQGTSTYTFSGDLVAGDWEIRLYRSGVLEDIYTDANLVATIRFTITDQ